MIDPVAAIKKVLPKLKGQTDYLVLLANATKDETMALARQFPEFNIVVTSDGQPEPPDKKQKMPGIKTLYIEVGHKGMNAIVLGLYDDPQQPVRYQSVPLDSRFDPASKEMKMLMAAYQDQLKALGFAGLGLRPVPAAADSRPTANSSARRSANHATKILIGYGKRVCTPMRIRRWSISIRRRNFDPSASVAT